MRISIAMASYNGAKYIREQLESFRAQTVLPLELVVCDDGSNDATAAVIAEFAATAPFPVYFHTNDVNLGYADNFFKAAKLCKGDWIAFSDQDDVWMPNKLATVQEAIESCPMEDLLLVAHTSLVADQNLHLTGKQLPSFSHNICKARKQSYPLFCVFGFSIIFSSLLVHLVDPKLRPRFHNEDKKTAHDNWVSILANTLGAVCYVKQPLAIWRRHDSAKTTTEEINASTNRTLASELNKVVNAFDPSSYFYESKQISLLAKSLLEARRNCNNQKWQTRLVDSVADLKVLESNLIRRGELYASSTYLQRFNRFVGLLRARAYGVSSYRSLPFKSLLKDICFTFGLFLK